MGAQRTAPVLVRDEGRNDQVGAGSLPILPSTDHDAAEFFRTSFAVLVRGKRVHRHLYFNLPAAERAVRRAHDRGDAADMILVELVPVTEAGDDHE